MEVEVESRVSEPGRLDSQDDDSTSFRAEQPGEEQVGQH